ncbi:MAG: 30S ribosomal protein S18 [Alphaproteobacteria bacterium]|nr:30S ribosomal protein S18 [Rickettsiales bacterium]
MSSIDSCSISDISYHNIPLLLKFISANGRIVPSRISSVSYAVQKELERAIKIARFLGLLPYVEY